MKRLPWGLAVLLAAVHFTTALPEEGVNYCQSAAQTSSKWDSYACSVWSDTRIDPRCRPRRWHPWGQPTAKANGMIVLFHGYTACPDSFDNLASALQGSGFKVLTTLTIGHGRLYQDCAYQDCVAGDPVSGLPTNAQGYNDWVDVINGAVANELRFTPKAPGFFTGASGLSLGAALATAAVARSDNLYSKMLLFPTFYGISAPSVDREVSKCQENQQRCIHQFVEEVLNSTGVLVNSAVRVPPEAIESVKGLLQSYLEEELKDAPIAAGFAQLQGALRAALVLAAEYPWLLTPQLSNLTGTGFGWGAQCERDRVEQKRAGYCNFRVKHLLGVHALGQWALGRAVAGHVRVDHLQIAPTQRDGATRNSMIVQAAQSISKEAQVCVYRIQPGCNPDVAGSGNTCGVPHSCIAPSDNLGVPPHTMYWQNTLLSSSVAFFQTNAPFGLPAPWNGNVSICDRIDVTHPPPDLIAPVPITLQLLIRAAAKDLVVSELRKMAGEVASHLDVPRWTVSSAFTMLPTLLPTSTQDPHPLRDEFTDETVTRVMFYLPAAYLPNAMAAVQRGVLSRVGAFEVVRADARTADGGGVSVETAPTVTTDDDKGASRGVVLAVGLLSAVLGATLTASVFLVLIRQRNMRSDPLDLNESGL